MKIHFPPHREGGPERVVGIVTCYELEVWESNTGNSEFLRARGPPSIASNGYRVFLRGKAVAAWCCPNTPPSDVVANKSKL